MCITAAGKNSYFVFVIVFLMYELFLVCNHLGSYKIKVLIFTIWTKNHMRNYIWNIFVFLNLQKKGKMLVI